MKRSLTRSELYWVNLDPTIGSEIRKRRPCVILSWTALNAHRQTVVVVPLSGSGIIRPPITVAVPSAGTGSNARIDQIRAVDKSRIGDFIRKIPEREMEAIENALRGVLGL